MLFVARRRLLISGSVLSTVLATGALVACGSSSSGNGESSTSEGSTTQSSTLSSSGFTSSTGLTTSSQTSTTSSTSSESSSSTESSSSSADGGSSSGSESSSGSGSGSSSGSSSSSSSGGLPGTQIAVGNDLTVYGVTSDGFVIYYDHTAGAIDAVSVTGGTVYTVSANPGTNFQIYTAGKIAAVWTNVDANNIGQLITWTALDHAKVFTNAAASYAGYGAIDATSTYLVYTANVSGTASCDVIGSRADSTAASTLASDVYPPPSSQALYIAGNHAVLNSASVTTGETQVTSYVLGTWGTIPITTPNAAFWGVQGFDAAGDKMLLLDPSLNLDVFPIGSNVPALIASAVATDTSAMQGFEGYLNNAGTEVISVGTGATTLQYSPVLLPAATVLATGTNLSLYAISPTEHTLVAYNGTTSEMVFGSATANGTFTSLAPALNFGGAVYTGDSSHILFVSNYDASTQVGQLSSFTVSTKTSAVIDMAIQNVTTFGTGAEAAFADNVTPTTADLKYFDSSSVAAPALIVSSAQPMWTLAAGTGSTTDLVYSWNQTLGATAGIYVTALP